MTPTTRPTTRPTSRSTTGAEATIRELQERFDRAELHDDRDVLRELIDEDFVSIGPKGFLLDKTQWIDRHDFFAYHELETTEVDSRCYGDSDGGGTVIVRNVQRNRATSSGRPVQVATRVSQVWVRHDHQWRLAGIQFSPLADA